MIIEWYIVSQYKKFYISGEKDHIEYRALYDFDSVGEGELGVKVGDVVTVTDTSLGQGWWMARSGDGREGVVPEAYLERLASGGQEVRKSSTVSSGGWGDDWDSDEEHK